MFLVYLGEEGEVIPGGDIPTQNIWKCYKLGYVCQGELSLTIHENYHTNMLKK